MMQLTVQTPTPNLKSSISFYETLGFTLINHPSKALFTDGQTIIEINPDRYARTGIKLYKSSWDVEVSKLEPVLSLIPFQNGHLIPGPGNLWVYLVSDILFTSQDLGTYPQSTLGGFAGISIETADVKVTDFLLQTIGFTGGGDLEKSPYLSWENNGFVISAMKPLSCPHLFFSPSLTYFNGKNNLAIIEKIRALHIPIAEEITHFNNQGIVDNIILRDPGGLGIFVFND
jgi:hypothetical protein